MADPGGRRRVLIAAAGDAEQAIGRIFADLGGEMRELMSKYDDKEVAAIVDWIRNSTDVLNRQTRRLAGD